MPLTHVKISCALRISFLRMVFILKLAHTNTPYKAHSSYMLGASGESRRVGKLWCTADFRTRLADSGLDRIRAEARSGVGIEDN